MKKLMLLGTSPAAARSYAAVHSPADVAGPTASEINQDDAAAKILSLLDEPEDGAQGGDAGSEQAGDSTAGAEPSKADVARVEKALEEPSDKGKSADADKSKAKDPKGADTETGNEAEQAADEAQPATPIEPPVSWKAEEKERFKALPPETQKYIVSRESERETVLTKANQEKADAVRQAKAAADSRQQDRNLYANNIDTIIAAARQLHPALAEGDRLSQNNGEGWRMLAAQDAQAAKLKWADYQALNSQLASIASEAQKARATTDAETEKQDQAAIQAANEALVKDETMASIWSDDAKRAEFLKDARKFLVSKGVDEKILDGLRHPAVFPITKLAMERAAQTVPYDQLLKDSQELARLKADMAKAASKKVPAQPGKTAKPQASDDGDDSATIKAAAKKANGMNTRDAANLLASVL